MNEINRKYAAGLRRRYLCLIENGSGQTRICAKFNMIHSSINTGDCQGCVSTANDRALCKSFVMLNQCQAQRRELKI